MIARTYTLRAPSKSKWELWSHLPLHQIKRLKDYTRNKEMIVLQGRTLLKESQWKVETEWYLKNWFSLVWCLWFLHSFHLCFCCSSSCWLVKLFLSAGLGEKKVTIGAKLISDQVSIKNRYQTRSNPSLSNVNSLSPKIYHSPSMPHTSSTIVTLVMIWGSISAMTLHLCSPSKI